MTHALRITVCEDDGEVMHLRAECNCGWWGGNKRPSRPGRFDEMRATLEANHAAWVAAQNS